MKIMCCLWCFSFVLSVLGHHLAAVQPPGLAITRPIWSERTRAWWPPWVTFGLCSRSPASPPDYHGNHLIWVDSILIFPLSFHAFCPQEFPLSFFCRTVYAYLILCLYCTIISFAVHVTSCFPMSYSAIDRISLLEFFNAEYCWLSLNCSISLFSIRLLFDSCLIIVWSWKCIPGISIS
jgi:hypothetical protein